MCYECSKDWQKNEIIAAENNEGTVEGYVIGKVIEIREGYVSIFHIKQNPAPFGPADSGLLVDGRYFYIQKIFLSANQDTAKKLAASLIDIVQSLGGGIIFKGEKSPFSDLLEKYGTKVKVENQTAIVVNELPLCHRRLRL